jgi:drug/metabolite transporter (DMT)-like permease
MLRHQTTGRRFLGLALASCAVVQWGTQPVVLKILVQSLDVFTLAWMRFVATAVLLFPLAIRRGGLAVLLRLRGRQLLLLGVAVFGLLANYLTYMAGLAYVTPGTAQMVNQLAPMLMLLGSLWIYGEPFGRLQWVGLAVLVVGLGLFFSPRFDELTSDSHALAKGVALGVISAVFWAVYLLSQKQLLNILRPELVLLAVYLTGTIAVFPLAHLPDYAQLNHLHLLLLAGTCLMTFLSYMCFANSIVHLEASRVGLVISLNPLVALLMAALFASLLPGLMQPESLTLPSAAGAACVVAGSMLGALGNAGVGRTESGAAKREKAGDG